MKGNPFVSNATHIPEKREHAKKHRIRKEQMIVKYEASEKTVIRNFILHISNHTLKQECDNGNYLFNCKFNRVNNPYTECVKTELSGSMHEKGRHLRRQKGSS